MADGKDKKVSRSILLGLQSSDRHCKQARGAGILLTKNNIQYISQHIPEKTPHLFPDIYSKKCNPGFPYQNRIYFIVFQIEMHNWAQKLMSRVPNTCITPESPKVFAWKT